MSEVVVLVQFHQHSSLPPEVMPHLGWFRRTLLIVSLCSASSIGTFRLLTKSSTICATNAKRAETIITVGFVNIDMTDQNESETKLHIHWWNNVGRNSSYGFNHHHFKSFKKSSDIWQHSQIFTKFLVIFSIQLRILFTCLLIVTQLPLLS